MHRGGYHREGRRREDMHQGGYHREGRRREDMHQGGYHREGRRRGDMHQGQYHREGRRRGAKHPAGSQDMHQWELKFPPVRRRLQLGEVFREQAQERDLEERPMVGHQELALAGEISAQAVVEALEHLGQRA